MANTIITYVGTGSTNTYTVPFDYLAKKFVRVTLGEGTVLTGGNQTDKTADYYFQDSNTIYIRTAPATGEYVTIRRYTSATERIVSFKDGSVLKAKDLDTSTLQNLHIAEEARDVINDALVKDNDGNWDAKDKTIINVKDPENPYDVVNKKYVDTLTDKLKTFEEYEKINTQLRDEVQEFHTDVVAKATQATASASTAVEAMEVTVANRQESEKLATEVETLHTDVVSLAKSTEANAKTATEKATEASMSEANARTYEAMADSHAQEAKDWANKLGDTVDGTEYSSKHYAQEAKKHYDATEAKSLEVSEKGDSIIASVTAEGSNQVSKVRSEGTNQINTITTTGTEQISKVTEEGDTQVARVSSVVGDVQDFVGKAKVYANAAKARSEEASASANLASTKASEAEDSANDASASATQASTYATNSANSAKASNESAISAKASSDSALAYKDSASLSADEAEKQAERAKGYAEQASSGQVNSDWDATSGKAQILNKPTLAKVATTGSYNDLADKPTIPSTYDLPVASSSTLGGVKVGDRLTISNGVLSADVQTTDTSNLATKEELSTAKSETLSEVDTKISTATAPLATSEEVMTELDKKANKTDVSASLEKYLPLSGGVIHGNLGLINTDSTYNGSAVTFSAIKSNTTPYATTFYIKDSEDRILASFVSTYPTNTSTQASLEPSLQILEPALYYGTAFSFACGDKNSSKMLSGDISGMLQFDDKTIVTTINNQLADISGNIDLVTSSTSGPPSTISTLLFVVYE